MENVETKTMNVGATDTLDKNGSAQEAAKKWTSEKLEASELTPDDRTQLGRLFRESFPSDLTMHEDAFVFVIRAPTACAVESKRLEATLAEATSAAPIAASPVSLASETAPWGDGSGDGGAEMRIVSMAVVRIEPKGSSFVRVVCTDRRFQRRGCTSHLLTEIVAFLSRSRTVTTTGIDADTGESWETSAASR